MCLISPKSARKPGVIIAEINFLKETHDGGFLLVEGDDDSKFWKLHVNKKNCNIRIAGSKSTLLGAAQQLELYQDDKVVGVIDADFDHVREIDHALGRVISTDFHDLEMILINSSAFERVLARIIDEQLLKAFETQYRKCILDQVLAFGLVFGRLRYLHIIEEMNFPFEFSPYKYIDAKPTLIINSERLYSDFAAKAEVIPEVLEKKLLVVPNEPIEQLIQGHDLLEILFIVLREIGCPKNIKTGVDLTTYLHLAFHPHDLCSTQMFQRLKRLDVAWNLNMLPEMV